MPATESEHPLYRYLPFAAGLLLLLLPACGGAQLEQAQTEVRALKDEVDELKRSQAAARVQFDEFRNRLVMIEERADTARVQRARRDDAWIPDLPTVRVEPGSRETPARQADAGQLHGHDASLDDDDESASPLPGSGGPGADLPPQLAENRPKIDDTAALYTQAKALLDAGQLPAARGLFERLIKRYPDHDLADNALYWIGESFYAQALWLKAAQAFLRVAKEHPRGNKVPDALLKLGKCYHQLGDDKGASDVLRQLARLYPGTQAAQLAAEELERMQGQQLPRSAP